ncbi:unnamed protein product [Cuscuta campestris]|uniref:Retrovirus-related Pol polyprotein from transposon TNT 1-94-like beta-barrel domain-containing protein n=1 Tax=Cuscuta campestris TaxID=132261 RepID=A0A484KQF8_9ASTE|nr:unnamed protein product [Cuscuta campestris]
MASNNTYSHSINLRYILESQKLSGENFLDWEKNLRIVLDYERELYILETDPPKTPAANARASELTSFKKYEDDARDVKCIIMASMTAELQRLHADMEVRPMIQRLRDLYQGQPQNSDIYVIEVNMSDFTSWVMDTGCGSHICTSIQNLHEVRHLTEGEVQLKVGNGALVNALAVGTYVLSLPSGLLLHLNNCLFVPAISRNIISVSCLDKAGFSINVKDKCLSVFRNDIYYATAKMTNGLYILDLDATVYNTWLSENFAMKDLGNASYALGIRIYRDRSRKLIGLCQSTYIDKVLNRFSMSNSKKGSLPMIPSTALSKSQSPSTPEQKELMMKDTTADSTTEAEYMGAAEAAKEGVWIKKFIFELRVVPSINDPIPLFCDNTGAIAQAKEPRSHQKTKHIVRRYHIIREIVDRGDVEICKVGTDDNIADPLTKPLGKWTTAVGHSASGRLLELVPLWPTAVVIS